MNDIKTIIYWLLLLLVSIKHLEHFSGFTTTTIRQILVPSFVSNELVFVIK